MYVCKKSDPPKTQNTIRICIVVIIISKIGATRRQILRLNAPNSIPMRFHPRRGWGSLQRSPRPIFMRPTKATSKGRKGEEEGKGGGRKGKRREGEEEEGGRKGEGGARENVKHRAQVTSPPLALSTVTIRIAQLC